MKIIIEINGKEVTLDESEAARVYKELGRVFGTVQPWGGRELRPVQSPYTLESPTFPVPTITY